MADLTFTIVSPAATGSKIAKVKSSFVANGTAANDVKGTDAPEVNLTSIATGEGLQPTRVWVQRDKSGKITNWFALFVNAPPGRAVLSVGASKLAATTQMPVKVAGKATGISLADRAIRALFKPLGIVSIGNGDSFSLSNFFAYGFLDSPDSYVTDVSMTDTTFAGSTAQSAIFLFTDPDSGFWYAQFGPLTANAVGDLFTLQVLGDSNQTAGTAPSDYQATGLVSGA